MREPVTRAWVYALLLLLVPLAVYWPTVFHEFGFRDDYAHLREAREIPGHLIRFTASYARPVYGALLVATVAPLQGDVANLQWLRLASVLLLALVAIVLMRLLQRSGWPPFESAAVGLGIALLPAAQMTVGWSIAWALAAALLLALTGFAATDAALARSGWSRTSAWALGFVAYLTASFIYQPSALFFVVPLAGALLLSERNARDRSRWTLAHLATAFAAIATGFAIMRVLFALGLLKQAGVMTLETDPLAKLGWFLSMPVANSLALFVLRDRFETPVWFWVSAATVAIVIAVGFVWRPRLRPVDTWTALFCLFVLPLVAFAVNLAAALRIPSYRVTYGLAGLVLLFVAYSLRVLYTRGYVGRSASCTALALLLAWGAVAANRNAFTLIAQPQGWEWQIMREAAMRAPVEPGGSLKVYVVQTTPEHRATRRSFADEFGSLSSDTDWAVTEMFKCALRRRFPSGLPEGFTYTLDADRVPPPKGRFDLVIDMRTLARYRMP